MNRLKQDNRGYALITALIVTAVTAALVLGFITRVNTEQRISRNDTDYAKAFYAAEAGLEKLNSDLSKLFVASVFPSQTELAAIQGTSYQPDIDNASYSTYSLVGGQSTRLSGALNSTATTVTVLSTAGWPTRGFFMVNAEEFTYTGTTGTTFTGVARGQAGSTAAAHANNAVVFRSQVVTLSEGANAGLNAQTIPFTLDVTAQVPVGAEARLTRVAQVALIPVFQFGIFSDSELSFFAGPNFNFGGRVHSNRNIFLSQGTGTTLTFSQKITSAMQIIRAELPNRWPTGTGFTGTVQVVTTPGVYGNLGITQGSVTGVVGTGPNPAWPGISLTTFNGNILNSVTGGRPLVLPFVADGYSPVELIRRPPSGEGADTVMAQSRLANQASLRIFMSDTQANLPGGFGYPMNSSITGGYTGVPFAEAKTGDPDFITAANAFPAAANDPLIDGYVYMERQNDDGTWADVTLEILNLGIANEADAILRLQKQRWDATGSTAADYVPINMYDASEGRFRDDDNSITTNLRKLGIVNVSELDVLNLKRWFQGTIGTTGDDALDNNGYIFYFSDRRGNRDASGNETAELGFEDFVNPADVQGDPNGTLDSGEDLNGNTALDIYGANLPYSPYSAGTDLYSTSITPPVAARAIDLRENLSNSDTTISVSSTTGFTAGLYRIDNEIVNCTAVASATTLTCTRGQLGTAGAGHNPTAAIDLTVNVTSTTATSFTVSSDTNVTVPRYYRIDNETVLCTSKAANVLTCERGRIGTTAATHNAVRNWTMTDLLTTTTTINLVSGAAFPTTAAYYRIDNETLLCTRATNTLTCTSGRGQLGTTAATHPLVSANISVAATAAATTFTFGSTAAFSSMSLPATLRIESEVVTCTARTATQFTGCTRGQEGTTAAAHVVNTPLQTRVNIRLVNTFPVNVFTSERASKNRVHYFRRALRLTNGTSPNLPTPGFTVAAENPVYVMGNYNSNGTVGFTDPHSFAAVMGDAVTLLSTTYASGGDDRSFIFPHTRASRAVTGNTWYRMAIASGKGVNFDRPATEDDQFFGTDGGAHNFLRYLEDWTGDTVNYRGSIVSLYYYRQTVVPFKCCDSVYSPPTRAYVFDTDFLVPSQLPPGTPRFRDINNLSFRQTIRADSD